MTFRKSPTDLESDDPTWRHYESLRSQALNQSDAFYERRLGLALFMRHGMLAWIEVCHRCVPAKPRAKKSKQPPVLAYGATSEMIKIMANITLCNLEEVLS